MEYIKFNCKYCNLEIEIKNIRQKASHIGNCKENPNRKIGILKTTKGVQDAFLKRIEKYIKNAKLCLNCNNAISYDKRKNKFCSSSCSASYTNRRKDFSNKPKRVFSSIALANMKAARSIEPVHFKLKNEYLNNKPKCIICNNELSYRKRNNSTCSDNCLSKYFSQIKINFYKENPNKHPNRLCAGKTSYPEIMFKQFLLENGLIENIDFIHQFKIGKYYVDFYFKKINLVIEIDGERWHSKDNKKEIDREIFIKKEFNIKRFWAKEITNKSKEKDIIEIINKVRVA